MYGEGPTDLAQFDDELVYLSSRPGLAFSHPWHTLVLDCCYKAHFKTSFTEFHPFVYKAFLEVLKDSPKVQQLIKDYCLSASKESSTHPNFLKALDRVHNLPLPDALTTMEDAKRLLSYSLDLNDGRSFKEAMAGEFVYSTTSPDRCAREFAALAKADVFKGIQIDTILDFGSSDAGFTGRNLARALPRDTLNSSGIDLICVDALNEPNPLQHLTGEDHKIIKDAVGYRYTASSSRGLLDLPEEVVSKLTPGFLDGESCFRHGLAVVATASFLPHLMDRGFTVFRNFFTLAPDIVILRGSMYDITHFPDLPVERWDIFTRVDVEWNGIVYKMKTYAFDGDDVSEAEY